VTGTNNRLLSDGTYRYIYDNEGNRTTRYIDADSSGTLNAGDPQHTTHTQYDGLGNVAAVTDPLGQTTTYQYDNLGRTISKTQPDPDGSSGSLTSPRTF